MIAGKEELLSKLNELPDYFKGDEQAVLTWVSNYVKDCLKLSVPPDTWAKMLDNEIPFDCPKKATLLSHLTKSCWPTNYPAFDFASTHKAVKTTGLKDLESYDKMEFLGLYIVSLYTLIYNLQKNE